MDNFREALRRNPERLSGRERAEREANEVARSQGHGYYRGGRFIPSVSFVRDYTEILLKRM